MLGSFLPGVQHAQNIHPLIVHFPIALLSAAVLLYFLAVIVRRESWAWTGLWMLGLGALGAVVAVITGLHGAEGVMLAMSVKHELLFVHRDIMLSVLGLSVVLTIWALIARPLPVRGRYAFLALLVIMLVLIAKGADYGGRMVYDYNAGGNACGQPIPFTK